MMTSYMKTVLKLLFYLLPFVLGVWGFTKEFGSFSPGVIYSALRLYTFNLDTWPNKPNALLWIAGFMAVAVTTTVIATYAKRVRSFITLRWNTWKADRCINVLGDETYVKLFMQAASAANGSYKVITSEEKRAFAAKHIVILGKTRLETLKLYASVEAKLNDGAAIHLNIEHAASRHRFPNRTVRVFGLHDNISRLFWRSHIAMEPKKIVLIGFGGLGQALLTQALQNNAAAQGQHMVHHHYHVIGDASQYRLLHPELEQFIAFDEAQPGKDSIWIHHAPWDDLALLKSADWVIFCDDHTEVNAHHLQTFVDHVAYRGTLFAYLENGAPLAYSQAMSDVRLFPAMNRLFSIDVVMHDQLQRLARSIHSRYSKQNREAPGWDELDPFAIQSNEAQAEHMYVKLAMLKLCITSDRSSAISYEQFEQTIRQYGMEKLAEIEHVRWCRFHWMNNWKYAPDIEGGNKDVRGRLHSCLVPYAELSEAYKEYDRETVRSMYDIIVHECGLYITTVRE